jgi:hypothetical protein
MSIPPIARAAAKVLAEESVTIDPPSAERRKRAVSAIGAEIAAGARRRNRARWAFRFGVAAAVIVAVGGAWTIAKHKSPPP